MNAILPSLVIALALAIGYVTWRLPARKRLAALRASLEGEGESGESDIGSGRGTGVPSFEPTAIRFDTRGRSVVAVDEGRRLVHLASVRGSLVERARVPIAQLESVSLVEEGENADEPSRPRRIGSLLLRITLPDERRSFYDIELLGRRRARGSARHRAALALGEEWLSRLEPEVGERAVVVELRSVPEIDPGTASAEIIESVDFFVDEGPAADAERADEAAPPAADRGAAAPVPAAVEAVERADAEPVREPPARAERESAAGKPAAEAPANVAPERRTRTRPAVVAASLVAGTAIAIGAFVALRGGIQPTAADASVATAREALPDAGRPTADAGEPAGATAAAGAASNAPAIAAALPGWETRADELESGTSSVSREALEALLAELTEIRSLPLDQALAGRRDRLIERLTWMHEREMPFYRQAFARTARRGPPPVAARTRGDGHDVLELTRHDFADAGVRDAVWAALGDEARALRFERVEFRVFRGGEPLASLDLAAGPVAPVVAGMD